MKRAELFFTLILLPIDFLALLAAGTVAFYSRFHPAFTTVRPVIFDLTIAQYLQATTPLILLWMAVFAAAGLYAARRRSLTGELARIALACSASMAAVFAVLFFSRTFFESRFIAVAAWVLAIAFVSVARVTVRALQRSLLSLGVGKHRVAVIGDDKTTKALMEAFLKYPSLGYRIVSRHKTFDEATHALLLKEKKDGLDDILLADPSVSREMSTRLLAFCETQQLTFHYSADFFASAVGRSVIHTFAGIPVIEVRNTPLDGWGAIYKRAFDIVCSLLLIVLTSPVQAVIVLLLFIEQPGRVLFSRLPGGKKTQRIGKDGKPFHYFKFRSMIKDAHLFRFDEAFLKQNGNLREGTPLFKLKDDPRVTRVGRTLRAYSLDELPEFYLVLLGHMSLVGPRPHLPEEVAHYQPHQRKVFTVRPGITGMAQTSGRADLDFDEEVRLDVHYIEHWSPWMDLQIILKTPLVVLFRKGAY